MSNIRSTSILLGALMVAGALAGCAQNAPEGTPTVTSPTGEGNLQVTTPQAVTGSLQQAGSSTVFPLAAEWAKEMQRVGIQITVAGGGSGAGASKLCAKEIDLGDMSRTMRQSEIDTCLANGVTPIEWKVAYDGLTVVVSASNDFVDYLSVEELNAIWKEGSTVQTWADVRAGFPAQPIELYGPDSDSGTYEYFNEVILGNKCGPQANAICPPRSEYTPSPDDNILVEGVASSEFALGHFGFAYFIENTDRLKAVPVRAKDASEAVTPTFDTIADGTYKPLSRPIFIYTNGVPATNTPAYVYFNYVLNAGQDIIQDVGYVGLDDATLAKQRAWLATGQAPIAGGGETTARPTPTPTAATPTPSGVTGSLQQAGSSTVFPIAAEWARELSTRGIQVTVAGGGSGAGASKICAKEVDIGDMSRAMKQSEIDTCRANGVEPVAWVVAYDGLTVVVSSENDFIDYLSVEELKAIWNAQSTVMTWADVRAGWPAQEIRLYGPDSDSGTYEYFNEVILGTNCGADGKQICGPRSDYTPSADDNILVEGVASSEYALGHFGFAYYIENTDRLKAVPIRAAGATTPVAPSFETIADGSYTPLSRPIFMVTNGVPARGTVLHEYMRYAMHEGQEIIEDVGYVGLDAAKLAEQRAKL